MTRANLIERFVLDAVHRKRSECKTKWEHLKDDLIFIILPQLANWAVRTSTLPDDRGAIPFTQSEELENIRNHPDLLATLEMAESHGLLKFSGLLEESRRHYGYPAFIHDNFRDFFAALYLRTLGEKKLLGCLSDLIEYFAWDEPLLPQMAALYYEIQRLVGKPPHVALSCGAVNGAAWVDDRVIGNEVVEMHSIKFDRSYKDKNDGQWKHTGMFCTEDLPKLAMVATELYRRLRLRSYRDEQQENGGLLNTDGSS